MLSKPNGREPHIYDRDLEEMMGTLAIKGNGLQSKLLWAAVVALGAVSFAIVALTRGEPVNAAWLVIASVCIYFIAYRFYALFIANKVLGVNPGRQTPAYRHNDGLDYVPTNRYVLFGHHFAAIAGAGPLVGPVLAAQMGYLPGTLWILAGVVFAGAVQDMIVLFLSTRRDGRSLADMVRSEMGRVDGAIAGIGILLICIIVLAVLALVVVQALEGKPVGHLHRILHRADRIHHGHLWPLHTARPHPGNVGHRLRAADGGAGLRPHRGRDAGARRVLQSERPDAGLDHHRLRLRRFGAAGMAAACAARLSVDLHEDRRDRAAGDRASSSCVPTCKCRRSPNSSTAPARSGPAASSRSCSSRSPAGRCPAGIR